jgi:tetratricopeptide (TPR) repeat protein
MGIVYHDKGELDKALKFYERSLEIREKLGDIRGLVKIYNNIGLVYKDKGEVDKALKWYEKGKKICEQENYSYSHDVASIYGNTGSIYLCKGRWEKAYKCFEKVILIDGKLGDMHSVLKAKIGIAICLRKMGKQKEARALELEIKDQLKNSQLTQQIFRQMRR